METRCNNLVYEHKHGRYGWHLNTRRHKTPENSDICNSDICIVCHSASKDVVYDEFLGGYVCKVCDIKREIGVLKR